MSEGLRASAELLLTQLARQPRSPRGAPVTPEDLHPADREAYLQFWTLPDGRLCGLHRLLMHWTVHVDIDLCGYADRYCYETAELAIKAMNSWDGTIDPEGWHRHPTTGRRRPDKTRASEFIEF